MIAMGSLMNPKINSGYAVTPPKVVSVHSVGIDVSVGSLRVALMLHLEMSVAMVSITTVTVFLMRVIPMEGSPVVSRVSAVYADLELPHVETAQSLAQVKQRL